MKWLQSLLKRGRSQCSFCGKRIYPPKFGVMLREKADDMAKKIGFYCLDCNKVACSSCSFQAAVAVGKNHMVCPSCGRDISESFAA